MHTPIVIEQNERGEQAYDIYSRLLKDRILFIGDDIDDDLANSVIAQLLFMSSESPEENVHLYINSRGGSVTAGFAIMDTMDYISPKIATYCIGQASSMAALLLAKGTKGMRYSLPSARIMIHQPSMHGLSGQSTDIQIYAKEIEDMRKSYAEALADVTGKDVNQIQRDIERDYIMKPQQALEYGIIDKIRLPKNKE